MKNFLLGSAAAFSIAISISSAQAADLVDAPVEFGWSGFYGGVQGGYAWGDSAFAFPASPGFESNDDDVSGFLGGVHVGYNWQVNQMVFGVVGDVNFGGVSGSNTNAVPGATQVLTTDLDLAASIRAKAGMLISNSTLVYATGGVAFADVDHSLTVPGFVGTGNWSETHIGWTVGGGAEMKLSPDMTIFVEGRYTDLGAESFPGGQGYSPHTFDFEYAQVQAGVSIQLESLFGSGD